MGKRNISLEERFLSKTRITDSCWIWLGTISSTGYGQISIGGTRSKLAHRVSYTLHRGAIQDGLTLDHLCRNTLCVNPDHLEPVTLAENVRRAVKGTHKAECANGHQMSGVNLIVESGKHKCLTCKKRRAAEYRAKHYAEIMVKQRSRQNVRSVRVDIGK
jgi:hypothetical protein